jgi:hypothetical protein
MSETTEKRTLVKKLAEVMGEVERVAKNGRNTSQNYDYATEADIAAAVRGGLSRRSVMMLPSVEKTELSTITTKHGGLLRLCTLTVRFTLEDGDSGETRSIVAIGEGTDTGDKASYKAMTGAEKYALMKLFLIPTGDDPEKDEDPAKPPAAKQASPKREPTESERIQAEEDGPLVPFGKKHKGKPMRSLSVRELDWYISALRANIDNPEKAAFRDADQQVLANFERIRRQKAALEEPAYGGGPIGRADHSHD